VELSVHHAHADGSGGGREKAEAVVAAVAAEEVLPRVAVERRRDGGRGGGLRGGTQGKYTIAARPFEVRQEGAGCGEGWNKR
jgi:hypothetical protein